MMNKQKISVSLGVTLKIDGYEFLRADVGYERELNPRDSREDAYETALKIVENQLEQAVYRLKCKVGDLKKDPEEIDE